MDEEKWEHVSNEYGWLTHRMKVDGGWLYRTGNPATVAVSFVPDVDLQRYQSHLRDAYRQGYQTGYEDASRDRSPNYEAQQCARSDIP